MNTNAAIKIRFVVGCFAICLASMEYLSPTTSGKWLWLKEALNNILGEHGYVLFLVVIGLLFIINSAIEFFTKKGVNK